jgi:hypothetical protein
VELEDLRFAAIGLLLAVSGMVALLIALSGAVTGVPAAVALSAPGVAMLVAANRMSPALPATVLFASRACLAAAAVWGLVALAIGAETTTTACYVALVGACLWARHTLLVSLAGPWWARVERPRGTVVAELGWIEVVSAERATRDQDRRV